MLRYDHLIFDLDGTLSDPRVGITQAVAFALRHMGITVDNPDTLTPFIGPPLTESFSTFYGFNEKQCHEASRIYRLYFLDRGWAENELYKGMPKLLRDLRQEGAHLYVATSKGEQSARRILKHFHLSALFDDVAGDTPRHRRPKKGDVIRYLLNRQGLTHSDRILMIGDRRHDIEGAREAGLPSAGVCYGYGSREELAAAGATHIVSSVEELRHLLIYTPADI